MNTKKTNILRIKRQYDYVGYDEKKIAIDTLQQWNADVENPNNGFWSDIKIVETDDDAHLGEI